MNIKRPIRRKHSTKTLVVQKIRGSRFKTCTWAEKSTNIVDVTSQKMKKNLLWGSEHVNSEYYELKLQKWTLVRWVFSHWRLSMMHSHTYWNCICKIHRKKITVMKFIEKLLHVPKSAPSSVVDHAWFWPKRWDWRSDLPGWGTGPHPAKWRLRFDRFRPNNGPELACHHPSGGCAWSGRNPKSVWPTLEHHGPANPNTERDPGIDIHQSAD